MSEVSLGYDFKNSLLEHTKSKVLLGSPVANMLKRWILHGRMAIKILSALTDSLALSAGASKPFSALWS